MNIKDDLLELLNKYIIHITKNYNKKNPFNINDELCLYLKDMVNLCLDDYNNICNLEFEKIDELISDYNKQDLRMLEYYQVILRDTEFELGNDDFKILKKIVSRLNNNIDKYITNVNNIKIKRENDINELVEPYQIIVNKINDSNKLDLIDTKIIYDILKVSNLNINKSVEIMRYLFNDCFEE